MNVERVEVSAVERDEEPDYRFSLANERTFLAYLRTALALDAGALAVVQLLPDVASMPVRQICAVVLGTLGCVLSVAAYRRWAANQRAMRKGAPLPRSRVMATSAVVVACASLVAVLLVALS
jgi:putative membrane protein